MRLHAFRVLFCLLIPASAFSATFGTVVVIGGHASDIALDEQRGQLYIANFAGKRIDVLSTADHTLRTPIRVDAVPGALALSPDNRFLIAADYAAAPGRLPSLTILDLASDTRSVVAIPQPPADLAAQETGPLAVPLAIAFGNGSRAFLVTSYGLFLVDPARGSFERVLAPKLQCGKLPTDFGTFPPQIVRASSGVSGDGGTLLFVAEAPALSSDAAGDTAPSACSVSGATGGSDTMILRYDVATGRLSAAQITSDPPLGPREISVDRDASRFMAGWSLVDSRINMLAQLPYPTGSFNAGSHAYDYTRNLIYADAPSSAAGAEDAGGPVLHILDSDNLTVRERIRIPEHLAGKAVFSSDMNTLYAISDSGVTVLPVGSLATARRVEAVQEQVLFPATNCDNRPIVRTLEIVDRGGGNTDFTVSVPSATTGVRFSQTSGTTPATITVEVDPSAFRSATGTTVVPLSIISASAINIAPAVRLLINTKEPDQRGIIHELPGKIVDLLSDPVRNRLYALRQDKNLVLVLDAGTFELRASLRTGNTPTQMAITRDNRYMIVANDNSQIANVFDLDALQAGPYIEFPGGHYPRSIAVSNSAILAIARNVARQDQCKEMQSPEAMVDRIDLANRVATTSCTLGIYNNNLPADSIMTASPSGGSIFTAMADGTVLLYDDGFDAFEASRKDNSALAGSYGAVSDDTFVAGSAIFNRSLVQTGTLAANSGFLSDGVSFTAASGAESAAGVVQKISMPSGEMIRPTRTIEAPVSSAMLKTPPVGQIGQTVSSFLRTMAYTRDGTTAYLSVSGLTELPSGFDNPRPRPIIASVHNAADGGAVAPGALMTIAGSGLAAGSASAGVLPLPTSLAEMCAAVNNVAVPLLTVAPDRIVAQMPFEIAGSGALVITSPGGKSAPFRIDVPASAPAVFRTGQAGDATGLPLIYRASNGEPLTFSNPVHPDEVLIIIATGLGQTSPSVASGAGGPSSPLAIASATPTIALEGIPLQIAYAGLMPGMVGVYQINAVVPHDIPSQVQAPLTIGQGDSSKTFSVRVVNP
jgi:uncharacterized protein (TIGR03437 family)